MNKPSILYDLNIKSDLADFLSDVKGNQDNIFISEEYDIPIYKSLSRLTNNTIMHKITDKKRILVLCGGGVRGICHIGVIKALMEKNCFYNLDTFAGTSIGAIIILLIVIGYNPDEIMEIIRNVDIGKMKSINFANFISSYGFDKGDKMDFILSRLLKAKGFSENITFAELYNFNKKKMIFPTVCVNNGEIIYLSHDKTPDLPVKIGARMSACIPIFFSPISYKGNEYIDGGCIDNYPIHLFKNRMSEVIGIFLSNSQLIHVGLKSMDTYLLQLIKTIFWGASYKHTIGYELSTIFIPDSMSVMNDNASTFDFDISKEKRQILFNLGYNTAMKLFE